jgi:hypothetical protein
MPTKSATTPESIDAELAAAEAEHRRLADKAAAIREAGDVTRTAVELQELHRAYRELPDPTRTAAIQARAELEAIANAPELDLQALMAAFDNRQKLDAECGSVAGFLGRLDQVDPLPPLPNGVERNRNPRTHRQFAGVKFSDYLDELISGRATAAYNARLDQLRGDIATTVDAAEAIARQQAAELAGGERLAVDTPATIADNYHRAIATITPEQIEAAHAEAKVADSGSGGSIVTTRNVMHREKLAELLDAERAGHADEDKDAGDR